MSMTHEEPQVEIVIPLSCQEALRKLRLWHWKGVVHHRKVAEAFRANGKEKQAAWRDGQANFHLGAVQTLNSYFPLSDYAEYDAAKENT